MYKLVLKCFKTKKMEIKKIWGSSQLRYLRNMVMAIMLLMLSIACEKQQPNILWVNCDDLGRELACYGNPDVYTPNMDRLAKEGILFSNAYANAPVCSSSRSSQITGMYPTAINCLNHRTVEMRDLPEEVVPIMEIFREAGYYCSNGWAHDLTKKGKEDYNFLGKDFFDGTDWKERAEGQPFFAQVQVHEPHRVFVEDKHHPIDASKVQLPACYPDHPLIREDWRLYLESVQTADQRLGKILDRLEKEGELENTIVMLFGDHGRPHLRDKQWLYEGGLAIPLIVRYPKKFKPGTVKEDLISLIDVSASSLALAGIEIPEYMDGKDILGGENRDYVFGFRQRCGDAVDDIRSITDGKYKLIWNREPERPYMQLTSYKKLQYPAFTLYKVLHKNGELEEPYSQFMAESRSEFELFDLKNDPEELNNLSGKEAYKEIQNTLFEALSSKLKVVEKDMVNESTDAIKKAQNGSATYGAKGWEKRGLSDNATDEEIISYWENTLLKK